MQNIHGDDRLDRNTVIEELTKQNALLRQREADLIAVIKTITNSRGWRALETLRRLGRKALNKPASPAWWANYEVSAVSTNDSTTGDENTHDSVGMNSKDELAERVAKLEQQLELVEKHHIRSFWHTLDRIDNYALPLRQFQCIVCDHKGSRQSFEILASDCIFDGGHLERYVCPNCDCIFGSQKFLDLDDAMTDLDYRLLYSRYRESDGSELEERSFRALDPVPGGMYINWGAGAWNSTTETLRGLGYDVWSYEPSAPTTASFVLTNPKDIPGKVSGIFSNNVIEHFRDPVAQFQEFNAMMAPGARMCHSSPCYEYLYPYTRFHTVFLLGRSPDVLAERTGFRVKGRIKDGTYNSITFEKI